MKKKAFYLLFMVVLLPTIVFAKEDNNMVLESQTVKYYKTIYNIKSTNLTTHSSYYTVEVGKEEYLSAKSNSEIMGNGVITTVYKKLTTSIYNSGNYYQYKAELEWLNMPSARSYDVIAIGHLSNVKYSHGINFSQYYCVNGGGCITTGSYYSKISNEKHYILDAAHIIPYADGGSFSVNNGILLSPEIHTLFDLGIISINYFGNELYCIVSQSEKVVGKEFLQQYHMKKIALPANKMDWPDKDALDYKQSKYFIS